MSRANEERKKGSYHVPQIDTYQSAEVELVFAFDFHFFFLCFESPFSFALSCSRSLQPRLVAFFLLFTCGLVDKNDCLISPLVWFRFLFFAHFSCFLVLCCCCFFPECIDKSSFAAASQIQNKQTLLSPVLRIRRIVSWCRDVVMWCRIVVVSYL